MSGISFGGISIHAPVKGATRAIYDGLRCQTDFNPRSREGSDVVFCPRPTPCHYFNPRSREGSDELEKYYRALDKLFQSTLP